jgi:hypothetical protein
VDAVLVHVAGAARSALRRTSRRVAPSTRSASSAAVVADSYGQVGRNFGRGRQSASCARAVSRQHRQSSVKTAAGEFKSHDNSARVMLLGRPERK